MDAPETVHNKIERSTNRIRYKGGTKLASVGKAHLLPRLKKELTWAARKGCRLGVGKS